MIRWALGLLAALLGGTVFCTGITMLTHFAFGMIGWWWGLIGLLAVAVGGYGLYVGVRVSIFSD